MFQSSDQIAPSSDIDWLRGTDAKVLLHRPRHHIGSRKRAAFDDWYRREHLPDAVTAFGAKAIAKVGHTHRLSVAFNTPATPPLPIEVVIVGGQRAAPEAFDGVRRAPRGSRSRELVAPAVNDPRLNRQLDNTRPITLEPR